MTTPTRKQIINANQAITRGNAAKPTRLPDGEVTFRIPENDWPVLMNLFPELESPDMAVRRAAWEKFMTNPLAAPYLVVRSPNQVRRSHK